MSADPAHAREAGFTLLELLVSISLLALLSVALVAGVRFGTRIWDRSQSANIDANAVRAAQTTITQDLVRIYPKFVVVSPSESFVDFSGSAQRMEFLSAADQSSGQMNHVVLEGLDDSGGLALRRETAPELARPQSASAVQILLRHLKAFDFAYFGARADEKSPTWHQNWSHEESLPLLIRVRAVAPPGAASWTELVVRPKIAADVGCIFDPMTKFCQGRR